eukprot:2330059-Pyramimonas_sp.AAC.1
MPELVPTRPHRLRNAFCRRRPCLGPEEGAEPSPGPGGPARKVQIQELLAKGEDVSTVKKLLIVLTKLSRTNAAGIREITGMPWTTALVGSR